MFFSHQCPSFSNNFHIQNRRSTTAPVPLTNGWPSLKNCLPTSCTSSFLFNPVNPFSLMKTGRLGAKSNVFLFQEVNFQIQEILPVHPVELPNHDSCRSATCSAWQFHPATPIIKLTGTPHNRLYLFLVGQTCPICTVFPLVQGIT